LTIPPPSLPSLPGEAVACDGDGMPCFDRLRYRRQDGRVFVYAFDLIELDGEDLRHEPIERRKAALAKLIRRAKTGLVLNDHIDEPGDVVFRHACKLGLERHRIEAPWLAVPSRHWVKSKNPKHLAVKREAEEDWGKLTRTHSLPRTCWREK